jgi:hypothetical protein
MFRKSSSALAPDSTVVVGPFRLTTIRKIAEGVFDSMPPNCFNRSGGFGAVYLVADGQGTQYALKKVGGSGRGSVELTIAVNSALGL